VVWALLQRVHDGTAQVAGASCDCDGDHVD
jgi:hypothetical protein